MNIEILSLEELRGKGDKKRQYCKYIKEGERDGDTLICSKMRYWFLCSNSEDSTIREDRCLYGRICNKYNLEDEQEKEAAKKEIWDLWEENQRYY